MMNEARQNYISQVLNSIKSGVEGAFICKQTAYWFPLFKFQQPSTNTDGSHSNLQGNPQIYKSPISTLTLDNDDDYQVDYYF